MLQVKKKDGALVKCTSFEKKNLEGTHSKYLKLTVSWMPSTANPPNSANHNVFRNHREQGTVPGRRPSTWLTTSRW